MAKKQKRRSISVTERHYVLVTKLAQATHNSRSATVELALEELAKRHGVEVTDLDMLDYRTRLRANAAVKAEPEPEPEDVGSGVWTF